MAIRTITDLPDVASHTGFSNDLGRFRKSKMEISYLSGDETESRYESNFIGCGELANMVAKVIQESGTEAGGGLAVDGALSGLSGLYLSGDVFINTATGAAEYAADLNFRTVSAMSQTALLSASSSFTAAAGDGRVAISYDGKVALAKWATVQETKTNVPESIVNMKAFSDLSARIEQAILAKIDERTTKGFEFPLLGMIYTDRVITSDVWKMAGSEIDVASYPAVKDLIDQGKVPVTTSIPAANTWQYRYGYSGTKLTFPKVDCFIQCTSARDAGVYVKASLPKPSISATHSLMCGSGGNAKMKTDSHFGVHIHSDAGYVPGTGSHEHTITGTISVTCKDGGVYSSSATTVQPESVKMYVYFYVG